MTTSWPTSSNSFHATLGTLVISKNNWQNPLKWQPTYDVLLRNKNTVEYVSLGYS